MLSRIEEINALVSEKIMDGQEGNYAEEISWAWLVVDKSEHYKMWRNPFTGKYTCELYSEFGSWNKWAATADTAPLAICLASLKAIE